MLKFDLCWNANIYKKLNKYHIPLFPVSPQDNYQKNAQE